eukprot:TRINITY_DN20723_c0_g1_i1.p1 TRINITY_DN20723_c0_g1~~TRINITY_DN20723_c0_g1_i1.p1  ORF type:complete len:319 (-),score=19.17 TRINITY_DN20723_c0_g1_i1:45-1001(-)
MYRVLRVILRRSKLALLIFVPLLFYNAKSLLHYGVSQFVLTAACECNTWPAPLGETHFNGLNGQVPVLNSTTFSFEAMCFYVCNSLPVKLHSVDLPDYLTHNTFQNLLERHKLFDFRSRWAPGLSSAHFKANATDPAAGLYYTTAKLEKLFRPGDFFPWWSSALFWSYSVITLGKPNFGKLHMHSDSALDSVCFLSVTLAGSKTYIMYPPTDTWNVCREPQFDREAIRSWTDDIKRAKKKGWAYTLAGETYWPMSGYCDPYTPSPHRVEVELTQGDALFVPVGWLHTAWATNALDAEDGSSPAGSLFVNVVFHFGITF